MEYKLKPANYGLQGELIPPADKSISHRSVILASLAQGTSIITNFLQSEDSLSTLHIASQLGVKIEQREQKLIITSPGFNGLKAANSKLQANNSGTTMRLMLGVLSGIKGKHLITGDKSLQKRPMQRVIGPLLMMQAQINAKDYNFAPITIEGKQLKAIKYTLPIASAQVKSALILAALFAKGNSEITEPIVSRNHTEQMLPLFGGVIEKNEKTWIIPGEQTLSGTNLKIPGDFSSAAFFITAGLLVPNSQIIIKNVNLNQTRTGLLTILEQMGAQITIDFLDNEEGNLLVKTSLLRGTVVKGEVIPLLIDELPLVALLATQAKGTTIIQDAKELRYKETDRIKTIVNVLQQFGAKVVEQEDGMIITGPTQLHGTVVSSYGDHRIGMMIAIAAQIAKGETILTEAEAVNISYPQFFHDLNNLKEGVR